MPEALKDSLLTPAFFHQLATHLCAIVPGFSEKAFISTVFDETWPSRELKDRMRHSATCLKKVLSDDFPSAVADLMRVAEHMPDAGFAAMIFSDYVALYGLNDWEISMNALECFTRIASAEFAIRPFILAYPERTIARMIDWSLSSDPALRRLSSEGARPRLPWGIGIPALKADPSPLLPILGNLHADPSETVRRSVSNNLNDIAKDHPHVVIGLLRDWSKTDSGPETAKLIRHALRSLVKQGLPEALEMVGIPHGADVKIVSFSVTPPEIDIGGTIEISLSLRSTSNLTQDLLVDYTVHHLRAGGKTGTKVFKWTRTRIAPHAELTLVTRHSIRRITTRTYYPGRQAVSVLINGISSEPVGFTLLNGS